VPLVWDGWVRAISSHRLLPGDVMVLQPGKALCDMVLLQGTCLVMESMLSGEVSAHTSTGLTQIRSGLLASKHNMSTIKLMVMTLSQVT